ASNSDRPSTEIAPSSGVSSPAMQRSVVVLPQPDGPSSVKKVPGSSAKLASRMPPAIWSVALSKILVSRSTRSIAVRRSSASACHLLPFPAGRVSFEPRGIEHHLADAKARGDQLVRAHGLRQRQNGVDQHLELAGGGRLQAGLHVGGALAGRADDGEVVVIEPIDVERHDAAAMAAGRDQPAVTRERGEGAREQLTLADILEHDVDAAAL